MCWQAESGGRKRSYFILVHQKSTRNITVFTDFTNPMKPADYIIENRVSELLSALRTVHSRAKRRISGLVALA